MTMTPDDFEAQQAMFEQLRRELDRLNELYDKNLKAMGLTEADLGNLNPDNEPPEIKKLLEEANQAAKRAGEDRVAAAKNQAPAPKVPPSSRRGGIKV
ncbi:MAG: hypothetical protein LBF58_01045 [Deltaproteobacteria bacterium]|jgi:hypothetical protein|nr:hypothetical protein [Deltaproteobacteria bacterium]